ncbi:ATP-binding protein [Sphaerisporangium rubeum]|uniref:Anti-sigma regulatory factor (Ser/Thr protein kinase) n=1 Tax=Sphaerisporangium rubeum TaxID=321317 RepID=A0A7X0IK56_9ACTN|nr:anti-sigma regulatory factor (Ser/Thr protein kinase) [Sphaerisporangium rubeum]
MKTAGLAGAVELPGVTASVPLARAYVTVVLRSAGRHAVDDAGLLTGELVANAVRHSSSGAGGAVRVKVFDDGRRVRVEVGDDGPAGDLPDVPAHVDPLSESGRGLWLVRTLSSSWGWERDGAGLVVWFEVTP